MAGENQVKSILFESIAVLAIPPLIYLMGYIYWDSYFSHFDINLAKINLPVYKVMIGATPAVYALILAGLLVYFFGKTITRTSSEYEVPITKTLVLVALVLFGSALVLRRQPKPEFFSVATVGVFTALLICAAIVLRVLVKVKVVKSLLMYKPPRDVGWYLTAFCIVFIPIGLFVLLEDLSETKAKTEADKLLKGPCEECSFVRFHFGSDTSCHLPDSLVLIASSESHYFVFSRAEPKQDKPTVFAVNKNSVSYMEIVPPEKPESAGVKQSD